MKPEYLNTEEQITFANRILKEVLEAGRFGCLSKADYETILFNQLLKCEYFNGKTNYDLANIFKVSESRIKSLRLVSGLRFDIIDSKKCIRKVLNEALKGGAIDKTGGDINILIENPIERREVENELKRLGRTPEYGRNREILKISLYDLSILLASNLHGHENKFLEWCKKKYKEEEFVSKISSKTKPLQDKIWDVAQEGGKSAMKIVTEAVINYGMEAFLH